LCIVWHFIPSLQVNSKLENSNIGIFPTLLMKIYENQITTDTSPITFKISGSQAISSFVVLAYEFSSIDNTIYLPFSLMNDNFLKDGDIINIEDIILPKIETITLQASTPLFSTLNIDHKTVLEIAINTQYKVIHLNDILRLEGCELEVTKLSPSDCVITHESDPEVEFMLDSQSLKEFNRKQTLPKKPPLIDTITKNIKSEINEVNERQDLLQNEKNKRESIAKGYVAFSGEGNLLGESTTKNPVKEANTSKHKYSNQSKKTKRSIKIPKHHKYQAFAGTGHSLK